jgi:hypothetical protein
MFNWIFFVSLFVGFGFRLYDGKIISIAAGLCVGVILNEVVRFFVYWIRGLF